jgi:Acetoacetate decarboxylase (ADC)
MQDAPAPWTLKARGYIVVLRAERGYRYAMFVDYADSPVGPYHELLFIPGSFRYGERHGFTITKIYVSSEASIVNGRRNWGIPKELATFDVAYGGDRIDRIQMHVGGRPAAALTFKHYPLPVPLWGAVVPARLRTLVQPYEGKHYTVAPSAHGTLYAAKLTEAVIDPALFPAFTTGDAVATARLQGATMTFPVATVT